MSWRACKSTIWCPRLRCQLRRDFQYEFPKYGPCLIQPYGTTTRCLSTGIESTSSTTRTDPSQADVSEHSETKTVSGIVRSIRKQKKVAFAHISNGSALEPVQAILDPVQARDITNGSYVELVGNWKASPGKGQAYELQVTNVQDVGEAVPDDYPIQKKSLSTDFLRSLPHLRLRTPLHSLLARARSQLISGIHDFYTNERRAGAAIQVHPPLITSSDCEGAGEVFTVTPKNIKPPPSQKQISDSQLYFKGNKYLTVSTQLHLEAYAAELGDVWTLSPTFRAEESDTPRHLSEFYMLEAEFRGVKTLQSIMDEAQQLLQHLIRGLADSAAGHDLLAYYSDPKYSLPGDELRPDISKRWKKVLCTDWPVISYKEAIDLLQEHSTTNSDTFVHPVNYDTGLQLEHERFLVSNIAHDAPLFVTNYPSHIKPFYMLPSDAAADSAAGATAQTVACFDLLFPSGTAEIVGGSLREHRLPKLIENMREKGLLKERPVAAKEQPTPDGMDGQHPVPITSQYPFLKETESLGSLQWYADLRRYGSSPHGGFGMGFDRLLAYASGISSIRETVGFPRYFGRADC